MYCVYFTIYLGQKLPPYYTGSTLIEKIQKGYRGSASSAQWGDTWKSELELNPHLFKTFIIPDQYADTATEILDLELWWQKRFNVVEDSKFVNQAYAKAGFCATTESALKAVKTRRENGKSACTEETKAKIGEANRGRKLPPVKEETRAKLSQAGKGRKHRSKTIEKIRESNTGKTHSEETKQKIRELKTGQIPSPESIAKRLATIEANGGYNHSEETKAKIGAANKGNKLPPVTAETRAKLSAALKGQTRSAEAMEKFRATILRKQEERRRQQELGLPITKSAAAGKPKSKESIQKRIETRLRNKAKIKEGT